MFKNIKKHFANSKEYNDSKRTVTLMIMNQYHDFLVSETEAKRAEKKAYESMTTFGDNFNVEDLQKLIHGVDKIANSPNLQTSYYEQISKQAHDEKITDNKAEITN